MNTPEPTYTLTKKELEAFVWSGWNMSREGRNSEHCAWSEDELQITVEDTVDEVLNELGKDQTK